VIRKVLICSMLAAAIPAAAEESKYASRRWGTVELSAGIYRPKIDSEFGGSGPFSTTFGSGRGVMFRADFAYSLLVSYGTLDLGIGAGYTQRTGKGQLPDGGGPSADETSIKIIPVRLTLTYRYDVLALRYRWLPLVPFGRVSLDRYNWWVTNGSGDTAKAGSRSGRGATNGYSFSGGLALLLDSLDPTLARDMDRNSGINHTYLFAEFTKSYIKDFGSSSSWDLSDDRKLAFSGGLMFQF